MKTIDQSHKWRYKIFKQNIYRLIQSDTISKDYYNMTK